MKIVFNVLTELLSVFIVCMVAMLVFLCSSSTVRAQAAASASGGAAAASATAVPAPVIVAPPPNPVVIQQDVPLIQRSSAQCLHSLSSFNPFFAGYSGARFSAGFSPFFGAGFGFNPFFDARFRGREFARFRGGRVGGGAATSASIGGGGGVAASAAAGGGGGGGRRGGKTVIRQRIVQRR